MHSQYSPLPGKKSIAQHFTRDQIRLYMSTEPGSAKLIQLYYDVYATGGGVRDRYVDAFTGKAISSRLVSEMLAAGIWIDFNKSL